MNKEVAQMTELEQLRHFVDFVNLWCTRKNVTDGERVSVIMHHPVASDRREKRGIHGRGENVEPKV